MLSLFEQQRITYDEYLVLFSALFETDNDALIAAKLALLNTRGIDEKADMILAAIEVMQQHMIAIDNHAPALDIVGTGGDGHNTLNFSTAAALALAASGINIIKHGNRSVSSRCGSADLLTALGIDINQPQLHDNFTFCFAPNYHPILKKIKTVREKLAIPTVFNLLGPLMNPARPSHAIIGVNNLELLPVFAEVCQRLSFQCVMLVHTAGTDELTCHGQPEIMILQKNICDRYTLDIAELGLQPCTIEDLRGGDAQVNAAAILSILRGEAHPARDTVCLNIASGLMLMEHEHSCKVAVEKAKALLNSGIVMEFIQQCQGAQLCNHV